MEYGIDLKRQPVMRGGFNIPIENTEVNMLFNVNRKHKIFENIPKRVAKSMLSGLLMFEKDKKYTPEYQEDMLIGSIAFSQEMMLSAGINSIYKGYIKEMEQADYILYNRCMLNKVYIRKIKISELGEALFKAYDAKMTNGLSGDKDSVIAMLVEVCQCFDGAITKDTEVAIATVDSTNNIVTNKQVKTMTAYTNTGDTTIKIGAKDTSVSFVEINVI